jgi:hypothetical protein
MSQCTPSTIIIKKNLKKFEKKISFVNIYFPALGRLKKERVVSVRWQLAMSDGEIQRKLKMEDSLRSPTEKHLTAQ